MVMQSHHFYNQMLAISAVTRVSTNKVERSWPVKIENTPPIVEGNNRVAVVAVVITPFVNLNNRVILVHECCKQRKSVL